MASTFSNNKTIDYLLLKVKKLNFLSKWIVPQNSGVNAVK